MQTFRKLLDQQGFEGGWRGDLADQGVFFKTSAQRRKPCIVYGCFRSLRILLGRSWRVQFYEQRPRATVETLRLRRSCSVHVSNQRTNSAFLSRCGFWLVKLCRSRRCHCPDEFASVRPFCQPSQIRDSGPIVVPPPAPALKGLCSLSLMRAESNKVHRRGRSHDCVSVLEFRDSSAVAGILTVSVHDWPCLLY